MGKKAVQQQGFKYRSIKRDEDQVENYHGTKVQDPYRWMETTNLETFCDEQTMTFKSYIENCTKYCQINRRIEADYEYPVDSCPRTIANDTILFFSSRGVIEPQTELWIIGPKGKKSDSGILVSPREFSSSRPAQVPFDEIAVSEDGTLLALAVSNQGPNFDWLTIHFRSPLQFNSENRVLDMLQKIKFTTLAITADNTGIFYACYPHVSQSDIDNLVYVPFNNQKLYYHRIGTEQKHDILIAECPGNPALMIPSFVTCGGQYLIITPNTDCINNSVYFTDLGIWEADGRRPKPMFKPITEAYDAEYHYVTCNESFVYFRTNKDAPNFRIILIDFNNPVESDWSEIVPVDELMILVGCEAAYKDYVICHYTFQLSSILQIRSLSDGYLMQDCSLPSAGIITEIRANRIYPEFYYCFQNFLAPQATYRVDLTYEYDEAEFKKMNRCSCSCISKPFERFPTTLDTTFKPKLPLKKYCMTAVYFGSRDKTMITMYLCHRKDLKLNSNNPCLLYTGLGLRNPFYNMANTIFMENMRGIVGLVNVREQQNSQMSLDDFHAAAEWVISQKYSNPAKLCIYGISDGGFVAAAAAIQRPELYKLVITEDAVLDLVRHRILDPVWSGHDHGDVSFKESFTRLYRYSPLHNVTAPVDPKIQYPAFLVRASDRRTSPMAMAHLAHSCKFVAELQHKLGYNGRQMNPFMFNNIRATGCQARDKAEDDADLLTFILLCLEPKLVGI